MRSARSGISAGQEPAHSGHAMIQTTLIVLLSIFSTIAIICLLVIISGTGVETEQETAEA